MLSNVACPACGPGGERVHLDAWLARSGCPGRPGLPWLARSGWLDMAALGGLARPGWLDLAALGALAAPPWERTNERSIKRTDESTNERTSSDDATATNRFGALYRSGCSMSLLDCVDSASIFPSGLSRLLRSWLLDCPARMYIQKRRANDSPNA